MINLYRCTCIFKVELTCTKISLIHDISTHLSLPSTTQWRFHIIEFVQLTHGQIRSCTIIIRLNLHIYIDSIATQVNYGIFNTL